MSYVTYTLRYVNVTSVISNSETSLEVPLIARLGILYMGLTIKVQLLVLPFTSPFKKELAFLKLR